MLSEINERSMERKQDIPRMKQLLNEAIGFHVTVEEYVKYI